MWYLIDVDDGVIATAPKKRDLSVWWTHSRKSGIRCGAPVYDVRFDEGRTRYLYSSREQAEKEGFGFALRAYHKEGVTECDAKYEGRDCAYCNYGYCGREPVPQDIEACLGFPHG